MLCSKTFIAHEHEGKDYDTIITKKLTIIIKYFSTECSSSIEIKRCTVWYV